MLYTTVMILAMAVQSPDNYDKEETYDHRWADGCATTLECEAVETECPGSYAAIYVGNVGKANAWYGKMRKEVGCAKDAAPSGKKAKCKGGTCYMK